jgi:S1-C subfamily serine protease
MSRKLRGIFLAPCSLAVYQRHQYSHSEKNNAPKQYLTRTFVADAVEIIMPAVVQLNCRSGLGLSSGSGFIVTNDGFIVTNAHVVANASHVSVVMSNSKTKVAKVHAVDRQSDIAVVKIEDTNEQYPVAPIGLSNKLRPGEFVIAIGSPSMLRVKWPTTFHISLHFHF